MTAYDPTKTGGVKLAVCIATRSENLEAATRGCLLYFHFPTIAHSGELAGSSAKVTVCEPD